MNSIRARAPVRVLDAGGWTDTWFAGGGAVCNLAVGPGVEVLARRLLPGPSGEPTSVEPTSVEPTSVEPTSVEPTSVEPTSVELAVHSFADRYRFTVDDPPGRHPLLEAAIGRWAAPGPSLEIDVRSAVPPGSGTGTSASVVVALIGALWALQDKPLDLRALARAAHQVEVVDLGQQSGVQDQVAASHGGASLVTVGTYPEATVTRLRLAAATWAALEQRLLTVYLGAPHDSTAVHEDVIARLSSGANRLELLEPLRRAAADAAAALVAGDLEAYGATMIANTAAQAALHPGLVGPSARAVIEVAARHGAIGWKVNGAGGDGGSVTIVGPQDTSSLGRVLAEMDGLELLALYPDRRGLRLDQGT